MKVKLADETELEAIDVRGSVTTFQNAQRDCLEFHFDSAKYTLDQIDEYFTEENCRVITLTSSGDDGLEQEFLHKGYCLRKDLLKTTDHSYGGAVTIGSLNHDADDERVIVRMAQMTYLEKNQADMADALDMLIISSLE